MADLDVQPVTDDAVIADTDDEARIAASIRRRRLVPTPRQAALGDTPADADEPDTDAPPPATKRRRSRAVRDYLRSVNPRSIGRPALPLLVMGLTSLLAQWDDAALGVLAPEIQAEFGLSLAFFAGVSSIVGVLDLGLALPFGYLADRVKRVWIMRLGMLVQNGASVVQATAPGISQLVTGRLVAGVGVSATPAASFSLMSDYYPARVRTRVFGFYYLAAGVGALIGPLIAGYLGVRYGWRTSLAVLGGFAVVVSLLTFLLREPIRGRIDRLEAGADEESAKLSQPPVSFGEGFRAAWSVTTVRRVMLATPFLYMKGAASIGLFGFYFSRVFVLSSVQRGLIIALYQAVGLVGLIVVTPLADRVLERRPSRLLTIAGALLAMQAALFVVMASTSNVTVAIAASVPIATVDIIFAPAFFALLSKVVPARIRGLGLQMSRPWALIGILLYPFLVAVIDQVGLHRGIGFFALPILIAAGILGSAASGVERDIRAADAANLAELEVRRLRVEGRPRVLICRDVDAGYDGVQVLFNVDFHVDEGELVALLGTNGAGKSTLLRAVAGIREATNGAIFFDGRDITHAPPHEIAALGVVMVPGGQAVFPGLSVEENLRTAGWLARDDRKEVDARIEEVLERFPVLRERIEQQAGNLSGGEQQMVALGQAFIMRPRLLMIDELSLGLAPAIVEQLLDTLRAIHATGTTIIIVEQSLNVALTVAERAVYMEKGEVRFSGPTEELLARPDLVRSIFIGGAMGGGRVSGPQRPRYGATAEQRESVLTVDDLTVRFGGVLALDGVSLEISAGEVVGIIGPNGAGKTTLVDAISGVVALERGTVRIAASDATALGIDARARLGLGRSFQAARLFPTLTVREAMAVFLERRATRSALLAAVRAPQVRRAEARIYRRVDTLVELLGLHRYVDSFVGELSTGTRRIVDVACILALEPKMLLLDEPSSGLAQAESELLGPLLQRIVRETGCGMLVIEHDVPLVASISHRLVAMELGRVLVEGTPSDVLADPRVLSAYLAASEETIHRSGSRIGAIAAALEARPPEED